MIVISSSLVLAPTDDINEDNPVIGWHNLVTAENVSATSEAEDYPIVNVANPITSPGARWRATGTTGEAITVAVESVEPVDYIAIARHNLGSAEIPVSVEGSTDGGSTWSELVQQVLLPDDSPALFRFVKQSLTHLRLPLEAGLAPAEIAVVYAGALLVAQRRIYVDHVPINYGRSENIVNGKSESGEYLGRIILSEERSTSFDLRNLTPAWYRAQMDPFIKASKVTPFFFAWRPGAYPREIGFVVATNNPQPRNQLANGMMSIQIEISGIAP